MSWKSIAQEYIKVGSDKNLSLAAKGLYMTLKHIAPFLYGLPEIQKYCVSNKNEVYAALVELAENGYIQFSDIPKYLGCIINEE